LGVDLRDSVEQRLGQLYRRKQTTFDQSRCFGDAQKVGIGIHVCSPAVPFQPQVFLVGWGSVNLRRSPNDAAHRRTAIP
jgi:hypothetical protein